MSESSDERTTRGRTTASSNVRPLVSYAVARGLERSDVLERFDIDPVALADIDGRLPLPLLARLWNELPALTEDPDMPLHVLAHAEVSDPPLAMLMVVSAPTLGHGLERLVRYERLNFDLADEPLSAIVLDGARAHIVVDHERSAIVPPTGAVIDSFLGILMLAQMTTKAPVVPLAIAVRHPKPASPELYRQALGCAVEFGAARDRLTLAAADLARPHPDASRTLAAIVQTHADGKLSSLPRRDDLLARVRRCVRDHLPDGGIALAELAEAMERSPRTLQRQLEAEGTSLRRVLDEERRALALRTIAAPRTSLIEIAFLLGFSDQSAFSRAFVRWTGCAPSEYRKRLR